jgi:formylglycine-generating enzyme required for sulfatase activity
MAGSLRYRLCGGYDRAGLSMRGAYKIGNAEKITDEAGVESEDIINIEGGVFLMGSTNGGYNNERPVHRVSPDSFFMMKHEVTFDEYDSFARETNRDLPDDEGWGRGSRPVINPLWPTQLGRSRAVYGF